MAKIQSQTVLFEADDDQRYSAKVDVSVTSAGEFSVEIPADLSSSVASVLKNSDLMKEIGYWGCVEYMPHRYGSDRRLKTKTLAFAIKLLNKAAEDFMKCEVVTERLITYKVSTVASMWVCKNGTMVANGGQDEEDGGNWWKPHGKNQLHSQSRESEYRVGIMAMVMDRKTFKRSSGKIEKWEYVRNSEVPEIEQLNGFCGISFHPEHDDFKTMPYTAEAARFFVRMILGICAMAKQLDDFFSDEKRLQLTIQKDLALAWGK